MDETRALSIITSLGRKYTGRIDIPNSSLRTTDLFNSSSTFWRKQQDKTFNDAILMTDAQLIVDEHSIYKKFKTLQLRLSKVILFYDAYKSIGSSTERKRSDLLKKRSGDTVQEVSIITTAVGFSFYEVSGKLNGLFKQKSQQRFIPLFDASLVEITKKDNKWFKKDIILPHNFIGVNTDCIESLVV